jgi:predicted small secreted protein
MNKPFAVALSLLAASFVLTGCAGMRTVYSDVNSYSQWPADRKPATYAFERLPSQQAQPGVQDALEAAARDALAKAGFTEAANGSTADVSVQLAVRINRYDYWGWDDPFWWHGGRYYWHPYRYGWWGPGFGPHYYWSPRYEREVAVLIRDRKTGQPLYESRARNESLTSGDSATMAAMFEAALKDFPQAAVNPRRVVVQLPEKS